jgi:hypothetical protein
MFRQLRSKMGQRWCTLVRHSPMWPVHGQYECRDCGRRYPASAEAALATWRKRATPRPALPLLAAVILASFAHASTVTDGLKGHRDAAAEAALARYVAGGGEATSWTGEQIEIHAALSKLEKTGWMRAIRVPAPIGESRYEWVQLAGDGVVQDQLILRYLEIEKRLAKMPAAAVAITPANYKFSYKGTVDDGERQAYVFRITPRRKRDGLIKGELWLDQRTGVSIRRSGRLVKDPSMLLRDVAITQDDIVRNGVIESRLTHIAVETRSIGRAQIVVDECPLRPADAAPSATWDNEEGQQ